MANDVVCFTGAVMATGADGKRLTRSALQAMATDAGMGVADSVGKGVTLLVQADPSSTSSKTAKAQKLGIRIISDTDFLRLVAGEELPEPSGLDRKLMGDDLAEKMAAVAPAEPKADPAKTAPTTDETLDVEGKLQVVHLLPWLHRVGSAGQNLVWRSGWTDGGLVVSEAGQKDGRITISASQAVPMNVGRSNETTPAAQAELEARSKWRKKFDSKYSISAAKAAMPDYRPMLAHSFDKRCDKIDWDGDVHVQPKLDGMRCLAFVQDGRIVLLTRGGKEFENLEHIKRELTAANLPPGNLILDGEIYCHGIGFQEICRRVKKDRGAATQELQFWIYDVVDPAEPAAPWARRALWLQSLPTEFPHLVPVETVVANTKSGVLADAAYFVRNGFEGGIVRLPNHPYALGQRSNGLLKVKSFQDAEFVIVRVRLEQNTKTTSAGKQTYNWLVFTCRTAAGKEFDAKLQGSADEHAALAADGLDGLIGQQLKVKFFDLTEDGVPRFPVGLAIRLPEDMDSGRAAVA